MSTTNKAFTLMAELATKLLQYFKWKVKCFRSKAEMCQGEVEDEWVLGMVRKAVPRQ